MGRQTRRLFLKVKCFCIQKRNQLNMNVSGNSAFEQRRESADLNEFDDVLDEKVEEVPDHKEFEEQCISYLRSLAKTVRDYPMKELVLAGYDMITDTMLLSIIGNCREVKSLNLFMCKKLTNVSIQSMSVFQSCKGMKSLTLSQCKLLTDDALLSIGSNFSKLQLLDMSNCEEITGTGIAVGNGCRDLRILRLSDCEDVTDEGIIAVGRNCKDMEELNLNNCEKLTDKAIKVVAKGCKQLQELTLNGCELLTDEAMIVIGENCKELEELHVWGCNKFTKNAGRTMVDSCKIFGLFASIHLDIEPEIRTIKID